MAAQLHGDAVDDRVVKALGHPTRVRILNVLRDRELASPVELSAELGVALGTVGYHVRRLESLGFIELAKRTQRRGAVEHHYRARDVLDLPAEPPAEQSHEGRAAAAMAVSREANALLADGGFDASAARADRRVVVLDEQAREQLVEEMAGWQARIEQLASESAERLDAGAEGVHRCVAVLIHADVADD